MGLYWNLWIVALTPSYEQIITSEMVNLGWDVTALSADGKVNSYPESKNSGAILCYRICDPKGHLCQDVLSKIEKILSKNKMLYFSLILNEASGYCSWFGSNIHYPEAKKPPPKPTTLN